MEKKLERIDDEFQTKTANSEELKREMQKLRQIVNHRQATISSLMADSGPLQVYYNQFLRKWESRFIYLFIFVFDRTRLDKLKPSKKTSRR